MSRWIFCLALLVALPAGGDEAQHATWDYGPNGPERWAELSEDWWLCGEGYHQSPIDLSDWSIGKGDVWSSEYRPTTLEIAHTEHVVDIVDNGHTIQVTYDMGSTLTVDGKPYELKQFHFHAPSEHTVEGEHYPVEMHLVHASKDGALAVGGIFFAEGPRNPSFDPLIEGLPDAPGESVHFENVTIHIDEFLPEHDFAWYYQGSLTTPPCTEGVTWLVAHQPVRMSAEQIEAFTSRLSGTNRPTQPRNGRRITAERVE